MLLTLPDLLTPEQVREVRQGIATSEFVSGDRTGSKGKVKDNLEINARSLTPEVRRTVDMVRAALMARPEFVAYAIPKRVELMFNRYDPGMYYADHVDMALMRGVRPALRSDLSVTLFLTSSDEYAGGELVLHGPFGEVRLKETAGTAVVYPSTMLHRVEPITEGSRWACVGWIQSHVRDHAKRQILYDVDLLRGEIPRRCADPGAALRRRIALVYQNLLRMWSEV